MAASGFKAPPLQAIFPGIKRLRSRLNLEIYPQFAILFYHMLTGGQSPPHPREISCTLLDDHSALTCQFDADTLGVPLNQVFTGKHNSAFVNLFARKKARGLANSLLISIFLQGTLLSNRIVFLRSTRTFVNINYEQMFNQFWNVMSAPGKPRSEPPPVDVLNLDDLFATLRIDENSKRLMQQMTAEDPEFLKEAFVFVLKAILLPTDTIQKMVGDNLFVYSIIEKQQFDWLQRALLNPKFRAFLLSTDITPIAESLVNDVMMAWKPASSGVAKFTPLGPAMVQESLDLWRAEIQGAISTRAKALKPTAEALKELKPTLAETLKSTHIMDFVLLHPKFSIAYKKDFVKEVMKDKIRQASSLAEIFAIVKELEKEKYALIRERDASFPYSLRGTAIKKGDEEIVCVASRYSDIRRFAKEAMYDFAVKHNQLQQLAENADYMEFIETHSDGYWCGFDSFLQYFRDTETARKIAAALAEAKELKLQEDPIYKFKKTVQDAVVGGFMDGMADLKTNLQFYMWGPPDKTVELSEVAADVDKSKTKPSLEFG